MAEHTEFLLMAFFGVFAAVLFTWVIAGEVYDAFRRRRP